MTSHTTEANRNPNNALLEEDRPTIQFSGIIYAPARLAFSIFSSTFAALRPFAPQLIPIIFCFLFIPFSLILSGAAGIIVWRNVAVGWESPIYLQFGDGIPPYALTLLPKLVSQQPYDISLDLTLPATESNYALGNFMTKLTLSTPSNKTLVSVRRPAIAYPPQPSFFRRKPSVISLNVPMLSSYVAGSSKLVAFVEIGRQDGWTSLGNGEGHEIRVVTASVRGRVVRHGIRGLVSRFPLIFALLSATTFLAIVLSILGACILPTILQHKPDDPLGSPTNSIKELPSPLTSSSDIDENPPIRRRRSRPSRSTSRKADNAGPSVTMIPSTNVKPDPLRRRRSRTFERLSDSDS